MNIELKSPKPIKYENALRIMEERLLNLYQNKSDELIWTLQHNEVYTGH